MIGPKCKIYLPALLFFPHVERHMLEALESIENWPNDRWTWQMGFSWKLHLKKLEQAYRQCNKSETSDQAGQAPEPKARNKNTLRFFSPTTVNRLYVHTSFHKTKVFRVRFGNNYISNWSFGNRDLLHDGGLFWPIPKLFNNRYQLWSPMFFHLGVYKGQIISEQKCGVLNVRFSHTFVKKWLASLNIP